MADPGTSPQPRSTAPIRLRRLPVHFEGDVSRVITRPFLPAGAERLRGLLERIGRLSEEQVAVYLDEVRRNFAFRHENIEAVFREHLQAAAAMSGWKDGWSEARQLLAGAFLTMEYAIESAALFNPSIVPHPDQSGLAPGQLRFVMSLRATGEGHVSSIVFRTGVIESDGQVRMDEPAKIVARARFAPDRRYLRPLFARKLSDMAVVGPVVDIVLGRLPESFTLDHLLQAIKDTEPQYRVHAGYSQFISNIHWLARSNYHIDLPSDADLSELVIFPMSEDESQGVEDLRLVRFTGDKGEVSWYGTYTAWNGLRILPMLIETRDFRRIEVHSINGAAATNKGMALFPRRINGHYAMCSRIDGENLYVSYSDHIHFWESAQKFAGPRHAWELTQMGNCGSPIETPAGWLLLTHGVGPMRSYRIGAMLLDLNDPLKVIGRLDQPLIAPEGAEREGYVPNVVYTCGALLHRGQLVIPYALADKSARIVTVALGDLLARLRPA